MFDRSDLDLEDSIVDYDADYVDETFVKNLDMSDAEPLTLDGLERAMDALEKNQSRAETESIISYNSVRGVLQEIVPKVADSVRKELYHHWISRRENAKKPLLRLYQKAPDPNNQDPSVAFRPRERDGGIGLARRMNTYENFRRATVLREELTWLRDLLAKTIDRENLKRQMLSVRLLDQRMKSVSEGGLRIEMVIRTLFGCDSEPVLICANGSNSIHVPCRGLELPEDISIVHKRLSTGEKAPKKARRKPTPRISTDKRSGRDGYMASGQAEARISGIPQAAGVDTFGFDDHGNKFLKHMRYCAGGFMNYGVSPYDHRVFAAASERNTVRCLPKEPKPVTFPSSQIKFGSVFTDKRRREGGKVGPTIISSDDIRKDILGEKRAAEFSEPNNFNQSKFRKTVRARGRVGRGGRIIFDRVTFERERGVKAASYPASVEMGGIYTGGIPLDLAAKVSEKIKTGALGNIEKLADDYNSSLTESFGIDNLGKQLIPPLQPMVQLATGNNAKSDILNYWPRRKDNKRNSVSARVKLSQTSEHELVTYEKDLSSDTILISERTCITDPALRKIPAYARRDESLVSEI